MSIYIKGFEVPKIEVMNGISLCLFKSYGGDIRIRNNETGEVFNVLPVPDHGRLIDADAMQKEWFNLNFDRKITDGTLAYWNFQLSKIPTIIEAEEGE